MITNVYLSVGTTQENMAGEMAEVAAYAPNRQDMRPLHMHGIVATKTSVSPSVQALKWNTDFDNGAALSSDATDVSAWLSAWLPIHDIVIIGYRVHRAMDILARNGFSEGPSTCILGLIDTSRMAYAALGPDALAFGDTPQVLSKLMKCAPSMDTMPYSAEGECIVLRDVHRKLNSIIRRANPQFTLEATLELINGFQEKTRSLRQARQPPVGHP